MVPLHGNHDPVSLLLRFIVLLPRVECDVRCHEVLSIPAKLFDLPLSPAPSSCCLTSPIPVSLRLPGLPGAVNLFCKPRLASLFFDSRLCRLLRVCLVAREKYKGLHIPPASSNNHTSHSSEPIFLSLFLSLLFGLTLLFFGYSSQSTPLLLRISLPFERSIIQQHGSNHNNPLLCPGGSSICCSSVSTARSIHPSQHWRR